VSPGEQKLVGCFSFVSCLASSCVACHSRYLRRDGSEVAVVAQCARGTDGHSGILHGGVTALLFDEATGWMNACSRLQESGKLTAFTDPANPTPFPVQPKEASKLFGFTAFLHVVRPSPFTPTITFSIEA
jgi:hypothetical protein